MTKGIKNPGLGGTQYNDSDSMLFEMLGVYRRPNLPPTPDGPGPATPPNPGGNVPGGKSNSGGGGKSGGGKGKGPQVDKTPPGQMKGGGGGSTPPTLNTTEVNAYAMWSTRTAEVGVANTAIDTYATTSDAVNFNTTTGEWTCPQEGWYYVTAAAQGSVINGIFFAFQLQKDTGSGFSSVHQSGYSANKSTNNEFAVPMMVLQFMQAGWKLRLYQGNDTPKNVYFNISSVWTSALFYTTKAASTAGTVISSYDGVSGFVDNYAPSSYFNTSTGVFTCPEAGRWVFHMGGLPNPVDLSSTVGSLGLYVDGVARAINYNFYSGATSNHTHNQTIMADLTVGQQVDLRQQGANKYLVTFGGFKIHDDAVAFCVDDYLNGAPDSGTNTVYTGYNNTRIDTHSGMNTSTGTYTLPSGAAGNWHLFACGRPNPNVNSQSISLLQNGVIRQLAQIGPNTGTSTTIRNHAIGVTTSASDSDTIQLYQSSTPFYEGTLSGYKILGANSGFNWLDPNG